MNLDDFAKRYTAAWCSQQPERVAAHFGPSGSLRVNGGEAAIGRAAIAQAAAGFMTAFPDLEVRLERLVTESERPEYHWMLVGTNRGPGGTGRGVRIRGVECWRMGEDGLIAESEGQFDAADYARQLAGEAP